MNKSVYFANENIWFTAYVVEDDNTPAGLTTNLLLNLLDSKGDVLASKNVFVNKGMGQSHFLWHRTWRIPLEILLLGLNHQIVLIFHTSRH
ncbi:hypothetical protein HPE56_19975 [Maribacter sp. ANRC-HE7]|uniref:Uncharacterized protein n=1 Tax=Maribacter aquimaris TaxID=2737171 RepID=A0ABR7V5K2_9FLAO|nr:hypothetical protein [Maribacter aquimaris]MBD0780083.1 hypothetical protein [Maribacter aquimaris]